MKHVLKVVTLDGIRDAFVAAFVSIIACILLRGLITPSLQDLYRNDPDVIYAPSHFGDARQYVLICNQGYSVPLETPTILASRLSWMPVYAILQCALHNLTNISLVYTGIAVSTVAIGLAVFFSALTLHNLHIQRPVLHAFVIQIPLVGAAWLYLPGAEATFLCLGAVALWLVTLPTPSNLRVELGQALFGAMLGVALILTKPNALSFLVPLVFAFLYRSWEKSQQTGYSFGFGIFTADVLIDHFRPALFAFRVLTPSGQPRPMRYDWRPLTVAIGIVLGFAFWLAYSSSLSGIPFYFLKQQLDFWGRAWSTGNMGEMLTYFGQAFRALDPNKPWNYGAAWSLAALLSAMIPAACPRVPTLIRGMLWLMVIFLLFTGTSHYASDRYIASTMLVGSGWGCWLTGKAWKPMMLRWGFVIVIAVITSYLLIGQMMPRGEPRFWGIIPDNGLVPW